MSPEKDKPIGVMIAMGKPKEKPAEEPEEPLEPEGGAFDAAASEAFDAAKSDDREGFAQALRLAIESLM